MNELGTKTTDITIELEKYKKKSEEMERLYQSIIQTNLFGIMEIDVYGKFSYANSVQGKILEMDPDEFRNTEIWSFLKDEKDKKSFTDHLTQLTHSKNPSPAWTGTYKIREEKQIKLNQHWNYRLDSSGNVIGFIGITYDSEEPENIHKENKTDFDMNSTQAWFVGKEEKYRIIAENAKELIMLFDLDGKITYVNESALEYIGYFEEELLDMQISDLLPPDHVEKMIKGVLKRDKAGIREIMLVKTEFINRNLKLIPMSVSVALVKKLEKPSEILIMGREIKASKP